MYNSSAMQKYLYNTPSMRACTQGVLYKYFYRADSGHEISSWQKEKQAGEMVKSQRLMNGKAEQLRMYR